MMIGMIFLLGIVNFAVHKAVIESAHPLLDTLPASFRARGGRLSLLFEFLLLVGAMLMAANGWPISAWVYGLYSALNIITGWLLLTGRF